MSKQRLHLSEKDQKTLKRYAERVASVQGHGNGVAARDVLDALFAKGGDAVAKAIRTQHDVEGTFKEQSNMKVVAEEAGSAAVRALREKMERDRKASHVNKVQQNDGHQWRGFD